MMMLKPSLFAEEEHGNRRKKLDDLLTRLTKHVDFVALAATVDIAAPRPAIACQRWQTAVSDNAADQDFGVATSPQYG
jgi:hypothetical protein